MVSSVHGLPALLTEGMEAALVPPALKVPRFLTVARAAGSDGTSQLVSFEGIGTLSAAKELVGKAILIRADDLPDEVGILDKDALIGARVEDLTRGHLGVIEAVLAGSAQDVFVLRDAGRELLIPVRSEFFEGRSDDGGIILDLPEGSILMEGE